MKDHSACHELNMCLSAGRCNSFSSGHRDFELPLGSAFSPLSTAHNMSAQTWWVLSPHKENLHLESGFWGFSVCDYLPLHLTGDALAFYLEFFQNVQLKLAPGARKVLEDGCTCAYFRRFVRKLADVLLPSCSFLQSLIYISTYWEKCLDYLECDGLST